MLVNISDAFPLDTLISRPQILKTRTTSILTQGGLIQPGFFRSLLDLHWVIIGGWIIAVVGIVIYAIMFFLTFKDRNRT